MRPFDLRPRGRDVLPALRGVVGRAGRRGDAPCRAPARPHLRGHVHTPRRRSRVRGCARINDQPNEGRHHHDHHVRLHRQLQGAPRQAAEGLEQRRLQQDRAHHRAGVRTPGRPRRRHAQHARPRRRHRDGPRRPRRSAPRCRGPRHGLRPRAARHRPPPGRRRGPRHRVRPGRRREPAVRRRVVRHRVLGHRRDVRRRPRPRCRRARPGGPQGRPDRGGQLDSRGLRRRHARRRRPARLPAARRAAGHPLGRRVRRGRAPRRRGRRRAVGDRERAPAVRQRRGVRRPVPHLLRPDVLRGQPARRERPGRLPCRPGRARPDIDQTFDRAFDQNTGTGEHTDGGVVCDWEYRIVTATKR